MLKTILLTSRNMAVYHDKQGSARTLRADGARPHALLVLGLLLTFVSLSGCQCFCRGTNAWSAVIDCANDHPVPFDGLYCSWLDLTRIGRPGGLPGRCCCECPECCHSGTVYAHRWNMPTPHAVNVSEGLQQVPDFPEPSPGPYFPPPTDEATPLFPMPPESAPRSPPEASPSPAAAGDEGVVRMHYERAARTESPSPSPPTDSPWLVPTNAIFGSF